MRYKMLGLEDKTGVKETEFEKGLRRRIELIYGIMRKVNGDMAYLDINIVFTRNLPQDLSAMVDTVVKLDGVISDESRVALLPLDLDAEAELAAVEEKKQQNYALFSENFNEVRDGQESTEE
jgi:SPP1 family phage portal protein